MRRGFIPSCDEDECDSSLPGGDGWCVLGNSGSIAGYSLILMSFDPDRHRRRSMRLAGHDYSSPGFYFVTVCSHDRGHLFGAVQDGSVLLSRPGEIVAQAWLFSARLRPEFRFDEWVIMPNHFHGIVQIVDAPLSGRQIPEVDGIPRMRSRSISSLMTGFKASTTKQINQQRNLPGCPVWQGRFYDRIIWDEPMLKNVRQYIRDNPKNWEQDQLFEPQSPPP
jgi:putative transposase